MGPGFSTYATAITDLNADGLLDVLFGHYLIDGYGPDTGYLNSADGLETIPFWTTATSMHTNSMAIADLDGDFDYDLVCGAGLFASDVNIFVYRNEWPAAVLDTLPHWESLHELSASSAVCLGDLDGDGDMDLVSGGSLGLQVYWNVFDHGNADIFDDAASWITQERAGITDLGLADIDRDGDLDLVGATNNNGYNFLLLNSSSGAPFTLAALWPPSVSKKLQLGDFNRDGLSDVLFTNDESDIGVYLNRTDPLAKSAVHPLLVPATTHGIALGDMDNDGDLDLVVGNNGLSQLYLNAPETFPESIFSPVPGWNNRLRVDTRDVALADIDDNGYLDVVCGNYNQADHVYLNLEGTLNSDPGWISNPADFTVSLAAGDVNQDGYPDLVTGVLAGSNRLYLNNGGGLPGSSSWSSGAASDTRDVVLGDVNGDGYLDLVCGNVGQGNTLYLFQPQEQVFTVEPAWQTRPDWYDDNDTWCIGLGDVDSDGYLDLVCGNDGQPNTLYLGSPITYFTQDPIWTSSDASPTRSLLLADVDGDGDLDLVCGNSGQANTLYRNENNRLSEDPVWYSDDNDPTTCLAGGDVDRDGDFDLVVGNDNVLHGIHYGLRNPAYLGDSTNPTHHLPDNPAYLSRVDVSQPANNLYRFSVTAIDIESDPFWLRAEYRYSDSPNWQVVESLRLVGPLSASPAGMEHQIYWDVARLVIDPPADRPVTMRLIAISISKHVVLPQSPTAFQLDLPSLDIQRAEIATVPVHDFPSVTVGDTVQAPLAITNPGNETLTVSEMVFPGSWLWLEEAWPFSVPAGVSHTCTFSLAPRNVEEASGEIAVRSNAALNPEIQVAIQTDIRGLTVETQALVEGDTAPLGEALTLLVNPDEGVHLEAGMLHYRPLAGGDNFTVLSLAPQGTSFIGVIPGSDVTEAGLEYYIGLENSGVFATDPPDTTGGNFYTLAVAAPESIEATVVPNAESGYLAGRSVRVEVNLPQGALFARGTLHHRPGGNLVYTGLDLAWEGNTAVATVPAADVGPRGLEYWVEVVTSTDSLTTPAMSPEEQPHCLSVLVQDLQESATAPGEQYRLASIPLRFGEEFTGTLEALLSDQAEFGSYDPLRWRSYRWLPGDEGYVELSDPVHAAEFRPEPGRGFWLICRQESRITTAPITGSSTPTDSAAVIVLEPGHNQIGHPFGFPVSWDAVLVDGLPVGDATGILIDPPWRWDPAAGYRQDVSVLLPFEGYFVYNRQEVPAILQVPPQEAGTPVTSRGEGGTLTAPAIPKRTAGWSLRLVARCEEILDAENRLGVYPGASTRCDRHDRREPPRSPELWLSLYFPHPDWPEQPGYYAVDVQGEDSIAVANKRAEGHQWSFDVAKNFTVTGVADEVMLEFLGVDDLVANLAPDQAVILVDRELLTTVDLRSEASYRFFLGRHDPVQAQSEARFILLVGNEDFIAEQADDLIDIPLRIALLPNRPNPFNPATVIRYELAQVCQASLRIYDVTGALVRTLRNDHHTVGRHEVAWRGLDAHGSQVAAGVYFYRLETDTGHCETRKMLLMK